MEYESGGRNLNTVSVIAIPDARPVAVTIYPYLNTASVIVIHFSMATVTRTVENLNTASVIVIQRRRVQAAFGRAI